MEMEKMTKIIEKYQDFYAKHKIGSRLAMIVSIVVYLIVSVFPIISEFHSKEIYEPVLQTVSWVFVFTFVTTILGANGLEKILDTYAKVKGKDNVV